MEQDREKNSSPHFGMQLPPEVPVGGCGDAEGRDVVGGAVPDAGAVPDGGGGAGEGGGGQDSGAAPASSQVHCPMHVNLSDPSQDEARRAPHCAMQRPPEVPVGGAVPESVPDGGDGGGRDADAEDNGSQLKTQFEVGEQKNAVQKVPGQKPPQEIPVPVHVLV